MVRECMRWQTLFETRWQKYWPDSVSDGTLYFKSTWSSSCSRAIIRQRPTQPGATRGHTPPEPSGSQGRYCRTSDDTGTSIAVRRQG